MVVRGRKLVKQASERLDAEKVPHGVLMAGDKRYAPSEKIQICSIDTIMRRSLRPPAKIIVIDEVHLATSWNYAKFISSYPDALVLGVTATPYTEKSIRHLVDEVIRPITISDLIARGYLVPPVYYAPEKPDLSAVRLCQRTKDFVLEQLESAVSSIVGNIPEHWKKFGENRPTLCFAVSVAHSKYIVSAFTSHGIAARHVDANTPDDEREQAFADLKSGKIKILSNVGILGVGVDLPFVSCLIMARPTKSYCLWIQQLGRGTRPFPEKKNFIVLDHAGNCTSLGLLEDEPDARLDGTFKSPVSTVRICKNCFAAYKGGKCPYCEFVPDEVKKENIKIEVDGALALLRQTPQSTWTPEQHYMHLKEFGKTAGYHPGWVYHNLKKRCGEEIARKLCKRPRFLK